MLFKAKALTISKMKKFYVLLRNVHLFHKKGFFMLMKTCLLSFLRKVLFFWLYELGYIVIGKCKDEIKFEFYSTFERSGI